jgi:hypothetical protein
MSSSNNSITDGSSITRQNGRFGALTNAGTALLPDDVVTIKQIDWNLTWVPLYAASGAVTITPNVALDNARFRVEGNVVNLFFSVGITTSALAFSTVTVTPPIVAASTTNAVGIGNIYYTSATTTESISGFLSAGSPPVVVFPFTPTVVGQAELTVHFSYVAA